MLKRLAVSAILALVFFSVPKCVAGEKITLNDQEYFSGPGFSFLLFHNNYQVGYQGGLQMILNDERVLDSGDLFLETKPGEPRPQLRALRREVNPAQGLATVFGEIADWNSGYQLQVKSDGRTICDYAEARPPARLEQSGAGRAENQPLPGRLFLQIVSG